MDFRICWRLLLESMMVSERREYLQGNTASGNKYNGFDRGIVTVRPYADVPDTP